MNSVSTTSSRFADREAVLHALYEAAELEHNLMCTYLYAAFSLKDGASEGLNPEEADAVARWRSTLIAVSVEEMSHLTAVWNITSALGGSPRFGRNNFPLEMGYLPASVVVKLAPFTKETLQHFVFLERPHGSTEQDGAGFSVERPYERGVGAVQLTPMGIDYDTVGDFYAALSNALRGLVDRYGEDATFSGDPALQLSANELSLMGAKPVICIKTALAAFDAIVLQGEGAPQDSTDSHYQKFVMIRAELQALQQKNPDFHPALSSATNPVLRKPPRPEGRVWLETLEAVAVVDLANASYGLMLRLLGYAYNVRGPHPEKSLAIDLSMGLMRAMVSLAERAARLPAGPANPGCNAGMSFTALRDSAPLPQGRAARRLFIERFERLSIAADALRNIDDARITAAADQLVALSKRAVRGFDSVASSVAAPAPSTPARNTGAVKNTEHPTTESTTANGIEIVKGEKLDLIYEGKRCIHARFCVTGAPTVFLANVKGPWIHPDTVSVEQLVEVAHACPSGAIRYKRTDGAADEAAPPVNLAGIREGGPYAIHGALQIDGEPSGFRATLCRCGASKNKPFCDSSHHEINFSASGEPATGTETDMLSVRDGVLAIDPEPNGPLAIRGNLEIISGTGRMVARVTTTRLCRCGGSATKPFCDGTHARIGFNSAT